MAGNIKLEIIYYNTEPDAVLEFGLKGNFAVRILTDHVQSAPELITAMKKAALRNEFLVIVGGFEDEEIIGVVAKAIGRELVSASRYMPVRPEDERRIPADAIPLIAENGQLCGAVVESGYQSILLLSEEKQRRDNVLKSLLLPYLSERYREIYAMQFQTGDRPPVQESAAEDAQVCEPQEEVQTPETETQENADCKTQAPDDIQPPEQTPAEEIPPAAEPDTVEEWQDLMLDFEAPETEMQQTPGKKRRVWRTVLCLLLVLALLCGSVFSYLFYFAPWQNSRRTAEYAAVYTEENALAGLREVDQNTAGWLKLRAADIESPVVNAGETKQAYYRRHLLDGTLNPIGTPYVTVELQKFSGLYLVRMDGYYNQLCRYLNAETAQTNRSVTLDSSQYSARWQVFSAFTFGKDPAFDYLNTECADAGAYAQQLHILKNASAIGKADTIADDDTVAVFAATRFGKTVVVAARLTGQFEKKAVIPTVAPPQDTSSDPEASSDIGTSVSSAATSSAVSVISYTPKNNKVPLEDKGAGDAALPPLSDEQIRDNLNFTPPPASSAVNSTDSSAAAKQVVTVTANDVNVRDGAGKTYKSFGKVNEGASYTYLGTEKDGESKPWYKIQYTASTVGYISAAYAKLQTASAVTSAAASSTPAQTGNPVVDGTLLLTVSNNNKTLQGSVADIVASVIEAEMGSGYPLEALKAQAVATYSFLLTRGAAKGTPVYVPMKTPGARCIQAVTEVLGQCAYYNNQVAQTYYYAISAGHTANCRDIWVANLSYLIAVESAPDANAKGFASEKKLTSTEVRSKLEAKFPGKISFDAVGKEKWFACTYDQNNLYCTSVLVANSLQLKGTRLYELLGLRSGAYKVVYDAGTDTFTFQVRGYGHGVGMSQVGAKGYAEQGWDYKKILQHYYPGVIIK